MRVYQQEVLSIRQKLPKVIDLETELEKWLDKSDKHDAIRIISGGPGSGKSSLTKIWAAKLSAQGKIKVLFVPLHHFNAF